MNYRRGFQRLYAILALAWIVGLLFVLPSDRLRFWSAQPTEAIIHGPWEADPYAEFRTGTVTGSNELDLSKYGPGKYRVTTENGVIYEVTVPRADLSKFSDEQLQAFKDVLTKQQKRQKQTGNIDKMWDEAAKSGDWKIWGKDGSEQPASRVQKAFWLAYVLFAPPAVGYAAIFFVIPWIYRGFRAKQI